MNELLKYDENFSEAKFLSFADNVFIKLHLAVMKENLEEVRHFITDEIYNEFKNKLSQLGTDERQMYGEINVKDSKIIECIEQEDSFILKVSLTSRYLDYVINKNTGEKIRGNDVDRIEKQNTLLFKKIKNHKEQGRVVRCPNCGANLDINNSGKCIYCGKIYKQEDYDWVLISIVSN